VTAEVRGKIRHADAIVPITLTRPERLRRAWKALSDICAGALQLQRRGVGESAQGQRNDHRLAMCDGALQLLCLRPAAPVTQHELQMRASAECPGAIGLDLEHPRISVDRLGISALHGQCDSPMEMRHGERGIERDRTIVALEGFLDPSQLEERNAATGIRLGPVGIQHPIALDARQSILEAAQAKQRPRVRPQRRLEVGPQPQHALVASERLCRASKLHQGVSLVEQRAVTVGRFHRDGATAKLRGAAPA